MTTAPAIRHPATGLEALDRYEAMLARWNGDGRTYATVEAYWRDPAPFEAEQDRERAVLHARFDQHHARNHLRCEVNEAIEIMALEELN